MWTCTAAIKLNLACESDVMTMTMIHIEKQLVFANASRIVPKNLCQSYVRVNSVHDMYRLFVRINLSIRGEMCGSPKRVLRPVSVRNVYVKSTTFDLYKIFGLSKGSPEHDGCCCLNISQNFVPPRRNNDH